MLCPSGPPPDELPPDELPPDELPPDELPPDELPPDELPPVDELPEDELPPDEVPPVTVTACWAFGAAWYVALPAWLASMTHEPAWLKVTVEPETEHTEVLDGSML
jgi:hypothetical protein